MSENFFSPHFSELLNKFFINFFLTKCDIIRIRSSKPLQGTIIKIFEMFYRATEQSDGSGIGLYIVKNAVEKLGGQIYVASRVGQGTRFNIILPNRINNVIHNTTQLEVEQ